MAPNLRKALKQKYLFLTAIMQEEFHQRREEKKIFSLGFFIGMDRLAAVTMRLVNFE